MVAVASGGPLETVVDGQTGFLCEGTAGPFAEAIGKLVSPAGAKLKQKMGLAGHARVKKTFTLQLFGERLDDMVLELHKERSAGTERKRQ